MLVVMRAKNWLHYWLHYPLAGIRFFARHIEFILISALIMVAAVQYMVRPQAQSLQQVKESGVLRVLISDEPDSHYTFDRRSYGFEYELLQRFAEHLEVEVKLDIVPYGELFTLLANGQGDLAVGGIVLTPFVKKVSTPTIPWYQARTTIVYKRGTERPHNVDELENRPILASARYFELNGYPRLQLRDDYRSEYELLSAVDNGSEKFVFAVDYRAKNAKHYLPNLNRGFLLKAPVDIVWSLPVRHDQPMLEAMNAFLETAIEQGVPQSLAEKSLQQPVRLTTYDALAIQRKIDNVLPTYEFAFRKAARRGRIDWHLLAAMAYQESRWSNDAKSPTGVRGIMQMTTNTAKFLGVDDRLDMNQSISGAARYIRQLKSRLPEKIKEPDRTWFAVASYNLGLKHIRYAYRRARELKLDRTKWGVVSDLLPTLYGKPYAKGVQAKTYVERVRTFTDILRFYDLHQRGKGYLSSEIVVAAGE